MNSPVSRRGRRAPMLPVSLLLLLLAAVPLRAGRRDVAAPPAVSLPDTPPGKQLAGWLAAVNSGHRETIRQFVAEHFAPPPEGTLPVDRIAGRLAGLARDTGGLTPRQVTAATAKGITVTAEAKRTGYWMSVSLFVAEAAPHPVLGTGLQGTEAPAELLPRQPLTDAELRTRIDALLDRLVEEEAFSGVLLVAKDGQPVYQRAVGLASRAFNVPNRVDTRFNIASIGKMFTAVAVAQLVEQGKLAYDDPLSKALPEYPNPEIARQVTVHHLLSHTSGLVELKQAGSEAGVPFRRPFRTLKEYLRLSPDDTLKFPPGSRLEYSNYGYVLLGAVIEQASGQDYYAYLREHVYRPAGMEDSDSFELDSDPPNLATGYMDAPGGPRRSNIFMLPLKGLPSGLGYSTAGDLARFAAALRAGKLLRPQSLEAVWTGRADYSELGSRYGYGCIVRPYNGTRIVGHGGGWFGITNKFDTYPDLGYSVVILNNIDSQPNSIAFKLREWLTQGRT